MNCKVSEINQEFEVYSVSQAIIWHRDSFSVIAIYFLHFQQFSFFVFVACMVDLIGVDIL